MSNDELKKYKSLYSDLISHIAELHNTHISFVKHCGRETGFATRKHLAALSKLANEMRRQGRLVYNEHLSNKKLEKLQIKEAKKNNKKRKKKDDLVS